MTIMGPKLVYIKSKMKKDKTVETKQVEVNNICEEALWKAAQCINVVFATGQSV